MCVFYTKDPMETDAAKALVEMGYSRAAVQLAIHEFNGRSEWTTHCSFIKIYMLIISIRLIILIQFMSCLMHKI